MVERREASLVCEAERYAGGNVQLAHLVEGEGEGWGWG